MKKIKALLLVMVLAITCVAFSACSKDPKSLKGEEVNRLEWLTAFEYVTNGVAGQDKSVSFTSYGTYNHYEVSSNDDYEDKKLKNSLNYTVQVNKNVLYAELSMSDIYFDETYEENEYLYIDNAGKETLEYSSTDKEKWKNGSTTNYVSTVYNAVNSLKNQTYKFNQKTGMYEYFSSYSGFIRIKFNNKKIVYIQVKMGLDEAEFFFTDYDKTEIKQNQPTVEKNKLEIAYNAVKGSTNYVTLSEDCSYLNFRYYDGSNDEDFEALNNALGLPNGSVVATMRETTDLNKRDTAKENGIIVTWVRVGKNYNNTIGGIYEVTYILE